MKLKITLIVLIASLFLAGSAQAAHLGPGEARAATAVALQRYYGLAWTESTYKHIDSWVNCWGGNHCQTRWEFTGFHAGEYRYGDAIIWRNRYGQLWYHVRPSPECRCP